MTKSTAAPILPARILPARILLVEADAATRERRAALLRSAGHETATAQDGQRALEALRDGPCDLLIATLDLPVLDGATLALMVASASPGIGIALLAGARRARNLDALADIVLAGEVQDADVVAAVEAVFAARRTARRSGGGAGGKRPGFGQVL